MRIRSSSDPPPGGPIGWRHARPRGCVLPLAILSLATLLTVVGTWYLLEGRGIVVPRTARSREVERAEGAVGQSNRLPTLHLQVDVEAYQAMQRDRDRIAQASVLELSSEGWQSGQIRVAGEAVPIQVRLKRDWADPLLAQKWPFEVVVQGEGAVLGMASFSMQSPATSGYLDRWLYLEDLRRAGVLAPRSAYANLDVNGEGWGIYALQEGLSGAMLEASERQDGVFLHLDRSPFWRGRPGFGGRDDELGNGWALLSQVEPVPSVWLDEFDTAQVRADSPWAEDRARALDLVQGYQVRRLPASEAFQAERLGVYMAHTNLWGVREGSADPGEWYYYNPSMSQLEPVGYGGLAGASSGSTPADLGWYDDLQVMQAYADEALRIAEPSYLAALRATYESAFQRYYLALAGEFATMDMELPWTRLPLRQQWLWDSLHPSQTVYAQRIGGQREGEAHVEVCNLSRYPVTLQKLEVGDREIDVQAGWVVGADGGEGALIHPEAAPALVLRGAQGEVPRYLALHIPRDVLTGTEPLQLVTSIVGIDETVPVEVVDGEPVTSSAWPSQPTLEEALERHPFLHLSDRPGFLESAEGTWAVEGSLILPVGYGLEATEALTLTFDRDAFLFATGPLLLRGHKRGGIHLVPKEENWAGLVIMQADPEVPSELQHVEISATSGPQQGDWQVAGGISFFESPVTLRDCSLDGSMADAALHVVSADVTIERTVFKSLAGHGVDGDFVRAGIERSSFHDIRGNAVDLSGSQAVMRNVALGRVYGRGVAAVEASEVTIANVRTSDVYVAVDSSDRSLVRAQGMDLAKSWAAGFVAHADRLQGGSAAIRALDVRFRDDSVQALVQEGSQVLLDGRAVIPRDLDLGGLERRQDALSAMRELDYRLGTEVRLIGYAYERPQLSPGGTLTLTLYWQSTIRIERDYTVFLHVLDSDGQTVVGWDNMPGQNELPTTGWRAGRLVEDTHLVPLPPDLPQGEYRVALGMYDVPTGERLPVYGPEGQAYPDARIVLEQVLQVR